MNFNFFAQSDIIFGAGAAARIPEVIQKHGLKHVFIVYDAGVKAAGIADKIIAQVETTGTAYTIFDKVLPNPANSQVEEAAELAKKNGADGFIAVGGGSSIDLAKAVNVLMTNPGKIGEYGGIGNVKNSVLPLLAIPTTAGTSSEITNVVALTDEEAVCKYVVIDNKITASDVIADPEFTLTMPPSVTAATGMDAITHAVESYISNMANPMTEYHSIKALQIFHENLPKVLEDGKNIEAREQMMLGCLIVGYGFLNANLGLVHAIAHTLSAHFHLPHGMANACVLPYVMKFNAPSCPQKMVEMAEAIGLVPSGDLAIDQYLLSEELVTMIKNSGIKTLSEQGIAKSDFTMLAEEVLKEPVLNFNPRSSITKEDIMMILEQAY